MNKLQENNLKAQIKLLKDINSKYEYLTKDLLTKSKETFDLLQNRTHVEETRVFSKESFNKIFDLVMLLKSSESWDEQLGYFSKGALKEIKQKEEILRILISGTKEDED